MPDNASPARDRATIAVLAAGVGSFGLLQSLVIPVLPLIEDRLDSNQADVTWVLTAYLLSAAVATPLIGRLGDAVGKRRMLVTALALLAAGSLVAALAPTVTWMIAARVLQGCGGGVLPLSFSIIRDEVPADRSGSALALVASLAAAAFGLGVVAAGPIVDAWGFRWLFWLPLVVTTAAAVATLLVVPESTTTTPGRISLLPAVLLSGWLVALLLGVSKGNDWGWNSSPVLTLFVTAALLMAAWVLSEQRAAVPLIDLGLMTRRGVWTSNVVAGLIGFAMFGALGFLPQLLQTPAESGYGLGASVAESGRILLPSSVLSFAVGFAAPRLVKVSSARAVICAGTLVSGVALAMMGLVHDCIGLLYVSTSLQGIGSGLVVSSLADVVLSSVPHGQSGVATGVNANVRTIGGAIGAAMMGCIVTAHAGPAGFPSEAGYRTGFLLLALGMVFGAGVSLLIPRSHSTSSIATWRMRATAPG